MDLDLSKVSYEGRWFDFGNGKLKIRPYPTSKATIAIRDGVTMFSGEERFRRFVYCLEAWEGFVTPAPEHKPIPLDEEVKRKLYDFRVGEAKIDGSQMVLVDFVTLRADEMYAEIQGAQKN